MLPRAPWDAPPGLALQPLLPLLVVAGLPERLVDPASLALEPLRPLLAEEPATPLAPPILAVPASPLAPPTLTVPAAPALAEFSLSSAAPQPANARPAAKVPSSMTLVVLFMARALLANNSHAPARGFVRHTRRG